jgi:hypothetical protein
MTIPKFAARELDALGITGPMAETNATEPEVTVEERVKKLDDNWEITEHIPWPREVLADIKEAIRAAVRAERERCAKVAKSWSFDDADLCRRIAAAIRAQPDDKGVSAEFKKLARETVEDSQDILVALEPDDPDEGTLDPADEFEDDDQPEGKPTDPAR